MIKTIENINNKKPLWLEGFESIQSIFTILTKVPQIEA